MGGGVGWEGRDGMGARLCNLGDDARVVDVVTSLGEEVHDIRAFLCHEGVGCGVSTYMQGEVRRKCAGATGGEREREREHVCGEGGVTFIRSGLYSNSLSFPAASCVSCHIVSLIMPGSTCDSSGAKVGILGGDLRWGCGAASPAHPRAFPHQSPSAFVFLALPLRLDRMG